MKKALAWLTTYFRGVQAELRKVVWPTFPVLLQHFVSVVVGLVVFTAFVAGVDYVFIHGLGFIVNK
ncbi:MAG: preprotein translocase subunit SecE [bacterium]